MRPRYSYFLKAYRVRHGTTTEPGAENNKFKGKKEALNSFLQRGIARGRKDKWDLFEMRDQEQSSVYQIDK